MDIFLAAYGSEAGVAALKWLPFGGLYIGGGIAPKQRARIEASVGEAAGGGGFMGAFRDKGRMSGLMAKVPVRLVLAEVRHRSTLSVFAPKDVVISLKRNPAR